MSELISLKELAKVSNPLDWHKEYCAIRKRAQRGFYSTYKIEKGKGFIKIDDPALTAELQIKLRGIEHKENPDAVVLSPKQSIQEDRLSASLLPNDIQSELSSKQLQFALSAAKLINLFIDHCSQPQYKGCKVQAQERFVKAYNDGAFKDILDIIGSRDVQTIRKWKKKYLEAGKDYRVLAPQYKTKRQSSVTPEQAKVLITLLLKPSKPLINEVIREAVNVFEAKRLPFIRSANTYRRFLEDWKKNHFADYVFYRQGEKGLDDLVLPYLERDWNQVEVGDILILDGHVNNYEIINPFTGLPKRMITVGAIDGRSQFLPGYEIAVTENILSIASCIRRAILHLGMIPKVIYIDNGKAFSSKYFNGNNDLDNLEPLFQRLGIRTIFAKAYHAQSKPIEPFWDWMSELERLIPTYTGTSIELKPPRTNRGEFLHRKLYEKAMSNTSVDIWAAHRAMAWWLDQYHNREKVSGHLKGLTPGEVFAVGRNNNGILKTDRKTIIDREELNFLMMDHAVTKLYRKGIRAFGTWYWHEKLFGKLIDAGDEVHIKYDIFDQSHVFVYDRHGELVCRAENVNKVHPAAQILGTEEDVDEVKKQLALKEKLKSSITGEAKQFLQEEIYPFVRRQLNEANILQLNENNKISEKHPEEHTAGNNSQPGGKKKRRSITDYIKEPEEFKTKNMDLISKTA